MNFQMFKLDLKKAEEAEIKLPTSVGSWKKQESSRKTSTSASLTMLKTLTVDHNKLENSSRDGNTRPSHLPLEKFVCRSGSNSLQETRVQSLGWEDPLEKRKATHPVFWPEEFHGLYSPWNSPGQNTGVIAFPFSRGSSQPRD